MNLAHITTHPPSLVLAIEALGKRQNAQEDAQVLLDDLSGITVLVAKKFTNKNTADGLLDAFHLTTGCISLAISRAGLPEDGDAQLTFLLEHGAEYVFQMGFRHIKELSGLPYTSFVSDFDNDPYIKQRDIKMLFADICRADPNQTWAGDEDYAREWEDRQSNQRLVTCAQWLRRHHHAEPIKDPDLDANAVIAIAVIFGIEGDGRIVARATQSEIEKLIRHVRTTTPDIEASWGALLKKIPPQFHPVLRECMIEYTSTIIKKIMSKASIKNIVTEILNFYACNELDVEYD